MYAWEPVTVIVFLDLFTPDEVPVCCFSWLCIHSVFLSFCTKCFCAYFMYE